jgi:transketolase
VVKGRGVMSAADPAGRQLYFGVREHGMGAVMNGMALHGGALPVGGTFLVFSDYMRGAVRLAALSQAHVVYSFTHDSVGVGEDGPTHQPVEHVASLRAMPGLRVIRPADANETAQAWVLAVRGPGPTALILSRQNLPVLEGTAADGVARGAYVLSDAGGSPDVVLIGTGSEVAVCAAASAELAADGIRARVVSMPCWSNFEAQPADYIDAVLPAGVPRVSVEAGVTFGWSRWADAHVGIDRFGASAPGDVVLDKLGINPSNVARHARTLLGGKEASR